MMQWKKDPKMKYVDMCMYIDENVPVIASEHSIKEVENKIYNYLWLLVKALAIKKHMFQNFEDYDGYAFYAANRLYFALKKNYQNQGKIIKGKEIRPIKSCLNYTKTLLYPMKIEYQREAYNEVISEEFVTKKFDALAYKRQLQDQAAQSQTTYEWTHAYVLEVFKNFTGIIDKVLKKSPFTNDSVEYKKLKISLMLNCLQDLKNKQVLDWDPATVILWKLPKSMSSYVRVLIREFYTALKLEIIDCFESTKLSDDLLDKLISVQNTEQIDYENQ